MAVLLIYPAASTANTICYAYAPLGLGYVAAALAREGVECRLFDINSEKLDTTSVRARLQQELASVDWVGISAGINGFKYVRWLISVIHELSPNLPVVLGGSICSPNPSLLLEATGADVACVGEGERTVVEIHEAFKRLRKWDTVAGIVRRFEGACRVGPERTLVKNLDELAWPRWDLISVERYTPLSRSVTVDVPSLNLIYGRGCPYYCYFCSPNLGRTARLRSENDVLGEMEMLMTRYGIRHFEFCDELCLLREDAVQRFCRALIDRAWGITWNGLGRVNILCRFSSETLSLLKQSGCHWICFGVESGSPLMLERMNKCIRVEEAEATIHNLRQAGIAVAGTFIFGYPGETRETIRETVEFCKRNHFNVPCFTLACPLPGTRLYQDLQKAGKIPDEVAFWETIDKPLWELVYNMTDFSDEELLRLKKEAEQEIGEAAARDGKTGWWT